MTSHDILDIQDNLSRYISQSQSVLTCLTCEQQVEFLSKAALLNILWLLADRLNDIELNQNKLFEHLGEMRND